MYKQTPLLTGFIQKGKGAVKMARKWFDALAPVLGRQDNAE